MKTPRNPLWTLAAAAFLFYGIVRADGPPPGAPAPRKEATGKEPAPPPAGPKAWELPQKADLFNDPAAAEPAPVTGGTLTVALGYEPWALNAVLDPNPLTGVLCDLVEDTLVSFDPATGEPRMCLAESMVVEDTLVKSDGTTMIGRIEDTSSGVRMTTGGAVEAIGRDDIMDIRRRAVITFALRRNVKWHDGEPFTARDVEYTFKLIKIPEMYQPVFQKPYEDVNTVLVLDDHTVRFTFDRECWNAPRVVGAGFRVLPRHILDPKGLIAEGGHAAWKAFSSSPAHIAPVGTGPYRVVKGSWKRGDRIEFERNPDYFLPDRAGHADRIVVRFIADAAAALEALKKGEVDFVPSVPPGLYWVETAKSDFPATLARGPYYYPNWLSLAWNMRKAPFNDAQVRKALSAGLLDLEEFNRTALFGQAKVITGPQSCFGESYDGAVRPPAFDPAEAGRLLTAAGWVPGKDGVRFKAGHPLKMVLAAPPYPADSLERRLLEQVEDNAAKLGAQASLQEFPWAQFIDEVEHLNFDVALLGGTLHREEDPYLAWHSSQQGAHTHNHTGFGGLETDAIIDEARKTFDPAKRAGLMKQLHARIAADPPCLFLYTQPAYAVYRKVFRGVVFHPAWPGYDLTEWYIPKELQK